MTKIVFRRSAGSLDQEAGLNIALEATAADVAKNLLWLIQQSDFFNLPEKIEEGAVPGEFRYTITIEAGWTSHTVHTSESAVPASVRPLLNELATLIRAI